MGRGAPIKNSKREPFVRHWSPTVLEEFFRCPRFWYLKSKLKLKVTTPQMAKGTFLHNIIEQLRLNHLRKRPRYKSAEAFGNVAANQWHGYEKDGEKYGIIKTGEDSRENKILWEDDKQPYRMKEEIRQRCASLYDILMSEEQPILFPKAKTNPNILENKKFKTSFRYRYTLNGRGFSGEIDEIRPQKVLRDYKTGIWKFVEQKTETALQPTFYLLTFCALCNEVPQFRNLVGVTEKEAKHWAGNPEYISETASFEYFMIDKYNEWDKEKKEWIEIKRDPILKTTRSDFNYKELCQKIDTANSLIGEFEDQGFYPAMREQCFDCKRFKELEEACIRMTEKADIERRQIKLNDFSRCHPKTFAGEQEYAKQLEFCLLFQE